MYICGCKPGFSLPSLLIFFNIGRKSTAGRHLQQALAEQHHAKAPPQANTNQSARVLILWQSVTSKTSEEFSLQRARG